MTFVLTSNLTVLKEDDDSEAAKQGIRVEKPEDLSGIKTSDLIAIYNKLVPSAPVKKFKDRSTAQERLFNLLDRAAGQADAATETTTGEDPWFTAGDESTAPAPAPATAGSEEKEEDVATATKKKSTGKKKATTKATSGGKRGRTPGFAGAKLYRVGDENPCRDGGLRAQSWELIKPQGITFEKFLEKGGRTQELTFNVRKGRVKVEFPKGNGKAAEE